MANYIDSVFLVGGFTCKKSPYDCGHFPCTYLLYNNDVTNIFNCPEFVFLSIVWAFQMTNQNKLCSIATCDEVNPGEGECLTSDILERERNRYLFKQMGRPNWTHLYWMGITSL